MKIATGTAARSRGSFVRVGLRGLFVLFFCGLNQTASAEFYQWVDDNGRKHISNIPSRGVRADGTLREAYDPNSIVYQHTEMLSSLRREAVAMEQERERAAAQAAQRSVRLSDPRSIPPSAPAEGWMNLDELIQLEKRGGRRVDIP
jgi:hypothetical protein